MDIGEYRDRKHSMEAERVEPENSREYNDTILIFVVRQLEWCAEFLRRLTSPRRLA